MNSPTRFLTSREVRARTSLSRATIWRRVREGRFPKPIRLGVNRVAWVEAHVVAWIEAHLSEAEG